jgi:hypothetical protein
MFKVIYGITPPVFNRLNKCPVVRAINGGVLIGLISLLPSLVEVQLIMSVIVIGAVMVHNI